MWTAQWTHSEKNWSLFTHTAILPSRCRVNCCKACSICHCMVFEMIIISPNYTIAGRRFCKERILSTAVRIEVKAFHSQECVFTSWEISELLLNVLSSPSFSSFSIYKFSELASNLEKIRSSPNKSMHSFLPRKTLDFCTESLFCYP